MMEEYTGPKSGPKWLAYLSRNPEARAEAWREHEVPRIVFGAVPGGTTKASVSKANHKRFNDDMDSYREARRHGLKPRQVSKAAVEEAEKISYGAISEHHRLEG